MRGLVVVALLAASTPVAAQSPASTKSGDVKVALTVVGLASIQPVDGTYVSPAAPYLDVGLGGVGPGLAAGLDLFTAGRFSAAFEVSTASISAVQNGRLVGGHAEGRLQDTLVSALAGVTTDSRAIRVLAGLSGRIGTPTLNGAAVTDPGAQPLALTLGFDAAHPVGARIAIVADVRYTLASRSDRVIQLGVGSQFVRAGAGVRVYLR